MTSTTEATIVPTRPALVAPIVSTQWLADHLGSDTLVVLDATVAQVTRHDGSIGYINGDDQYLIHGHIPGSVFADLIEVFSDSNGKYGFAKPSAEQFVRAATSVGIDNDTTVVIYDNSVGAWAARLWWLFRTFGYNNVAVLNGGLPKWRAEDREVDFGYVAPRDVTGFSVSPRPELWIDKAGVTAAITAERGTTLLCGVPRKEFAGEHQYRSRPGYIPGSINVPASRLIDRETNTFKSIDELSAIFADVTTAGSTVIAYCAGGIASSANILALTLLGYSDVVLYDGSLNEWAADESTPLTSLS